MDSRSHRPNMQDINSVSKFWYAKSINQLFFDSDTITLQQGGSNKSVEEVVFRKNKPSDCGDKCKHVENKEIIRL